MPGGMSFECFAQDLAGPWPSRYNKRFQNHQVPTIITKGVSKYKHDVQHIQKE